MGLFNRQHGRMDMQVDFRELGFQKSVKARDVWQAKDLGSITGPYKVQVPGHGVVLLRVSDRSPQPSRCISPPSALRFRLRFPRRGRGARSTGSPWTWRLFLERGASLGPRWRCSRI